MAIRIQNKRDTAANWTSNNPTLLAGEIGFETNTLKFKIGDGATAWNSLAYQGTTYTDEMAQDAVGGIVVDSNTVDLIYSDAVPSLAADVRYQTSNSITLGEDSDGLLANLKTQNSTTIALSVPDVNGLKADVSGTLDCGSSVI